MPLSSAVLGAVVCSGPSGLLLNVSPTLGWRIFSIIIGALGGYAITLLGEMVLLGMLRNMEYHKGRQFLLLSLMNLVPVGLWIAIHFTDQNEARHTAEWSTFRDVISEAMGYLSSERADGLVYDPTAGLVYPPSARTNGKGLIYHSHSLVVASYSPTENSPKYGMRYHYGCPEKWLAKNKQDVKLVVFVSKGTPQVIGSYTHSGSPAYNTTWYIVFVDMPSHRVVAREETSMSDPQRRPDVSASTSRTPPPTTTIVSIIRKTVSLPE